MQTDGKLLVDKARAKRTKGIQSVGIAERQNNSVGWGTQQFSSEAYEKYEKRRPDTILSYRR